MPKHLFLSTSPGDEHGGHHGGTKTLPEILEKSTDWLRSLGLIPLKVKKEILGFCFNSVWRAIKKQSLYLWGNGFVDFRE